MNDKRLKLILDQLGEQAFPADTDPWTPMQELLASESTRIKINPATGFTTLGRKNTLRLVAGIGLALLILITTLAIIPERQALADAFKHLFRIAPSEQYSIPPSYKFSTPTFAPSFAATLAPVSGMAASQTDLPTTTGMSQSSVNPCGIDPYGYACRVAWAEQRAGFEAKEFPADPKGFVFKDITTVNPDSITMEYDVIGGGGYLFFNQGIGNEFPTFTGEVPESAIQEVQVVKNRGEYVVGDYVVVGHDKVFTWLPCCRFRLRWMEGNHWFELDKEASQLTVDYMTEDVMIQMATELVDRPNPVQEPRADYLTSLGEASQLAEFDILSPAVLPEGFQFDYGKYDKNLSQLQLVYSPAGTQGIADITIIETPINKVNLAPGDNGESIKGEEVDINGYNGTYFSDSPYNHVLTWQVGYLKITLSVYSSELWYGATFTKDQILEIARSMK